MDFPFYLPVSKLTDYIIKIGKNCYPQLLKECKYSIKDKHISDDLQIFSDDSEFFDA